MEERLGDRFPLAAAALFGAILGRVQFGLFFTDSTAGVGLRVLAAAVLGAGSGVLLGRLRPRAWLALSMLAAWGAIVAGAIFGFQGAAGWGAALLVPAAFAALGGFVGAAWARRRSPTSGPSSIAKSPPRPAS
jgi:hypothetical protein